VIVRRARLDEILALRHAVLRPGRPLERAWFDGDDDPTTVHVAALQAEVVVGCATVMRRPFEGEDAAHLRGMATRHGHEGRGVGTAVLSAVEAAAQEWGVAIAWCNARTSARAFYERAGWTAVTPEFDIPDVGPHVRMTRRLTGRC
jgi:GNAT superfamily N-acetyltransferase